MILLTGQRPGEVCGMTWAEIGEENAFWDIPDKRTKNSEPQRVPLCPMALEIIEQARTYSGQMIATMFSDHPTSPIIP